MTVTALVIDSMPLTDSPTEGKIIQACMLNMGWDAKLISKGKKSRVLEEIYKSWRRDVIHIAAHGNNVGISAGRGWLTVEQIRRYFMDRLNSDQVWLDDTRLLLNSGCDTYSDEWKSLIRDLTVRNYIAPINATPIRERILVSIAIYTQMWGQSERLRVVDAFSKAKSQLRNLEGGWRIRSK